MANEKNKLEEVIHLYLGCECKFPYLGELDALSGKLTSVCSDKLCRIDGNRHMPIQDVKPILRSLSDITEEECVEVFKLCSLFDLSDCEFEFGEKNQWINASIDGRVIDAIQFVGDNVEMMNNDGAFSAINPISPIFHYYLSKGFDLFSLIETGQAIDKNTLQETKN